jgi:hypothetical protein
VVENEFERQCARKLQGQRFILMSLDDTYGLAQ